MLKSMSMSKKAIIAMIAGYIFGMVAGMPIVPWVAPIGKIFINLLFMVATPFIFFSITTGVASMSDLRKTGRVGLKITALYLGTTLVAALLGLALAFLIGPGEGFTVAGQGGALPTGKAVPTVGETLVNMVPRNVFASLSTMSLVQVICFAIFLGVGLVMLGEAKKPVMDVFETMTNALIKVVEIIMKTVPLGVFALMAETGAKYGLDAMESIAKLLFTEYAAILTQMFLVLGLVLILIARVNPVTFYKRTADIILTALSTTSSSATLPVTIRTAVEKIGIPRDIAGFTLPLGATVNLNGAGLNIAICVVFSAQVYGVTFSPSELTTLILITCISAVGAAGMPGSAIVFTLAILSQYGIPAEAFALVIAVYRLLDMGLTTINILGDVVCTAAVAQSEGVLDRSLWDNPPAVAAG